MSGAVYINEVGSDSHSLEKTKRTVIPLGPLITQGISSHKTTRKYCLIIHKDQKNLKS